MVKNQYNAELNGNIMIIGSTNSGKTSLIQKWAIHNFFGNKIQNVYWVSSLTLDSTRKNEIDSYFSKITLKFAKVSDCNDLEMFIEDLKNVAWMSEQEQQPQQQSLSLGETNEFTNLVIFDDMLTIADKSKSFSHFLTVSRKYGYTCIYVLHNLMNNNGDNWQLILANTTIIVLFKSATISFAYCKYFISECYKKYK